MVEEEIKFKQINENYEVIYRGEAKFEEDLKETIKIGRYAYDKNEVEEKLKDIKPIN